MARGVRTLFPPALALALAIAGLLVPAAASAASNVGFQGPAYSGVTHPPTSDKPQSKLWFNDGSWWAYMWTTGSGWHIWKLDRSTESWRDTGVLADNRTSSLGDVLWDGAHLFIASQVATVSAETSPVASRSGQPARLYRYSYSAGRYTLDSGFPTQISNNSSESLTIDKDSTGALWATWTQVSGSASAGWTNTVYVNQSSPGGTSWGTPFVIPGSSPHPSTDDISAIIAFQRKIGVMWTDQNTGTVWFAWRSDGTPATASTSWHVVAALRGNGLADDHLDIKSIQSDGSGRVVAAVKTSLNDTSTNPSLAQVLLLVFKPATGAFTRSTVSTTGDCVTRPQVLLDPQHGVVHVFQVGPSTSVTGCPFSGVGGAVYEKTAALDNPVFARGRGTPIIQDGASANVNDPTTTKQDVSSATGMVILASNDVTKRYWFADRSIAGTPAAPVASFTAIPTSGAAPLVVQFTDTSTGSPTAWSWSFGDGATSTAQSPSHSYGSAGTYSVTLTASNPAGSSTSAAQTITVSTGTTAGAVTAGGSTTASSPTATSNVTVTKPAGVIAGDVLIAQFTADANPTVSSAPSGWATVVAPLSIGTGARVFAYYHVVTNAGAEPASYAFGLSAAVKWNAGVADFHGVNTTSPFDTAAVTKVDTTYSASTLTVGGVTTATAGAMLVGGVGLDSGGTTISPPTGWTGAFSATGAQSTELADQSRLSAGATGSATWTLSAAGASGGWLRALRPA